jgi:hypothetical protein
MNHLLKQAAQVENKIEQKLITYQSLASKIEEELFQDPILSNSVSTSEELFGKLTEEIDFSLKEVGLPHRLLILMTTKIASECK